VPEDADKVGLFHSLTRFFGQIGAVADLASGDEVAKLVPDEAQYVTAGLIAVLADIRAFNGGEAGAGRYGRDLSYLPRDVGQEIALLVLAAGRLVVIDKQGCRWSCVAGDITALDGHRRSGFLVMTRGPEGLAVSQQTPVETPPGARFQTVRGMTNIFSGWDQVLTPFGVERYF
jgi:hypothetical protein